MALGVVLALPAPATLPAAAAGPSTVRQCHAPAVGGTGAPGVGGAGAGDPYFPLTGNQGYDVQHYDLDLDFTPATHHLAALATITALAEQPLIRFDLDFSGPEIQKILIDGRPATYRRDGQELVVTPADALRAGEEFTVKVWYQGRPEPINDPTLGLYGWVNTADGAVALNEPEGARTWYPVNDDLQDKATYTFHLTTPTGVTALANGERRGDPVEHDGRTTVTWAMQRPMAADVAMVAIGRFKVTESLVGAVPDITAYDPSIAGDDSFLHRATGEALTWEQARFGPYPFDSVGGIIDPNDSGYALETQSRPVYDVPPDRTTVVHEISHQWFGDNVTPRTWRDLWLNEGFATYVEWLWKEDHGGRSTQATFDRLYATPASSPFWQLKTGDPGRDQIFNQDLVYTRGAMTVHVLRKAIGDDGFATLLRTWNEVHRYGNADTCDLIELAQTISGKNLQPLFQAWLYTAGKPVGS